MLRHAALANSSQLARPLLPRLTSCHLLPTASSLPVGTPYPEGRGRGGLWHDHLGREVAAAVTSEELMTILGCEPTRGALGSKAGVKAAEKAMGVVRGRGAVGGAGVWEELGV